MLDQTPKFGPIAGQPMRSALAVCALIAAALLLPKGNFHRNPVATTAAIDPQPQAAALRDATTLTLEARLGEPSQPAFYSVCHGFSSTGDSASPYHIDYTTCPLKRTQVMAEERVTLTLPKTVETVLIEVWPLHRVEQPRYILTNADALQRDGLNLQ